jgi:hypothetical protein
MNCDQIQPMLIELVYDELAPKSVARADVEAHLGTCPTCRAELAQLRAARAALAAQRASEPTDMRVELTQPRHGRRWLPSWAAIAAAVLIGVLIWFWPNVAETPATAAPVEIKRLSVSLTILSEPEDWPQRWPGMALVRDQRIVRHLKVGQTAVRFTDVPKGILPDTVRLRSIDPPGALTILEQNYQYDLASAAAVFKRYIDLPIAVAFKDGPALAGVLLSFDDNALVIRPPGQGPRSVARQQVKAVSFAKLPQGLLTRPTLLWQLQNDAQIGQQQFEVAYLTHGLTWRADYMLKLHPAKKVEPGTAIVDTADLVGYATVTNNSGVTYADAQLKLMAGDVNLIPPEFEPTFDSYRHENTWWFQEDAAQFQEKSFFEYHLYTLGRPTTIRDAETKQIELVSGSDIKLRRAYVYDQRVNPTAARVVSEFKNSKANGLGKPLPKGVVRLYAPDPTGVQTYVSQTTIDHTPVDEKLRLPWGFAFDIACSYKQTDARHSGAEHAESCEYILRNHKDHDVTITIIARVDKTTYEAECNYPWHVREVGVVEISVPVKAHDQTTVTFSHRYNHDNGGGLTSPHDKNEH